MSEEGWVTLVRRVPRALLPVVLEAEKACLDLLRFHGRLPNSLASQAVEVTEAVYSAALLSFTAEDSYHKLMLDDSRHERQEALAAMDRDGWRCLICGRTGINKQPGGSLESHHIVPRSCHDERIRPADPDHRSNKATLCREHHQLITNPTSPRWHWRAIAPALLRAIGNPERAAKVEETCTDPLLDLVADGLAVSRD